MKFERKSDEAAVSKIIEMMEDDDDMIEIILHYANAGDPVAETALERFRTAQGWGPQASE